ncbi:MAG: hypothetical protein AAFX76_12235 [Planctomycetota bacterium]
MKPALRPNSTAVPAALVALSLAACAGTPPQGSAISERRTFDEQERVVASLMACLEAAAREMAGQPVATGESRLVVFVPPVSTPERLIFQSDAPAVALRPHLSRLNLPPPVWS